MRRALVSAIAVVLVPCAVVLAQGDAEALAPLQGRWVVTGGEHQGRPLDAIKGGVMAVTGNAFEIRTASGNMLKGTLLLDTSARPFRMDMLHADGTKWEAIYETAGDTFRLNYVEVGGKDVRPTTFATADSTEASIIVLRREDR
jgi:uncharacterized protein (TIGR03067 family)